MTRHLSPVPDRPKPSVYGVTAWFYHRSYGRCRVTVAVMANATADQIARALLKRFRSEVGLIIWDKVRAGLVCQGAYRA